MRLDFNTIHELTSINLFRYAFINIKRITIDSRTIDSWMLPMVGNDHYRSSFLQLSMSYVIPARCQCQVVLDVSYGLMLY